MNVTGPNPLNGYCFSTSANPVETTESILQNQLKSSSSYEKKNDSIDEKQGGDIKKNENNIKTLDEKVEGLKMKLNDKADKAEIPSLEEYYTKEEVDAKFYPKEEIDSKFYPKEEVDSLILAKSNEIYELKKLVGDIGGAVSYDYPNEADKTLTTLLGLNGTVKLTEDTTFSRYAGGITSKNKVKLNLNGKNLTSTNAGNYGVIMARGYQEITIGGKGVIEAGDGICIEANGKDSVINLTGSTTEYHNNRSAELIYCYAGTINISGGIFRNDTPNNFVLNCFDANYKNGTAKIVVTGGKFYDFNPGDNKAEGEGTSFLAEGYTVVESKDGEHTVYTVKKA